MTRQELVRRIEQRLKNEYQEPVISRYLVRKALEDILWLITETLQREEAVKISRFGTFRKKVLRNKKGRDFRTGSPLSLPPKVTVSFHPSPKLTELLNR